MKIEYPYEEISEDLEGQRVKIPTPLPDSISTPDEKSYSV